MIRWNNPAKYHNIPTELDGIKFDSRKEARRYAELKLLERAGKIEGLERQVKYVLIPTQRDAEGNLIEKECSYYADFRYFDTERNALVVEDTKGGTGGGTRTEAYRIKKKLMLYTYGIIIHEI